MKRKDAFWLSLVFAIALACAPMLAQAAPQDTPPPPNGALPAPSPTTHEERDAQHTISGPYRLTYTLTEMDGEKRTGFQRYEVVQDANSLPSEIYLDSLVPVHLGSAGSPLYDKEHIGMKISAHLRQFSSGIELSTDVSQTGFDKTTNSGQVGQDSPPVTRVSKLVTTALLTENKPITIGNFDMPGSTHVLQIQVELTKLP